MATRESEAGSASDTPPGRAAPTGGRVRVSLGELVETLASLTDDSSELALALERILRSRATWDRAAFRRAKDG